MHCFRGILKIAEVVSRFDNVGNFIDSVSTFGFSFLSKVSLSYNREFYV